jgi:transcription termination/antitermination protein NusG
MNHRHPSWYGLYVRPRFENVVAASLSLKGLDLFLPTYATRSRRSAHKHVEVPLFPNYVFCRVDAAEVSSLLMIPGVVHIVGVGLGVNPLNEREIGAIKLAVQAGLACQPCPFLRNGRRVRVSEGPLRDVEGILAEAGNGTRIVLGISLLERAVLVELGKCTHVIAVLEGKTSAMSAPAKVS